MLRVILIGSVCGFLLMMFLSGGLAYAFSGGVIMPGPLKFTEKELLVTIKGAGYGLALGLTLGVILGYLRPQISGWLVGGVVGFATLGIIGAGYFF
jgi:hypothetical protein